MKPVVFVPVTGLILVILASGGCTGHGFQPGALPAAPGVTAAGRKPSASVRRIPSGVKSRVDRAAAKGRLLYVADAGENAVLVYTYPQLAGAGILTGFAAVEGVCSDRRGYVWVLSNDETVTEFAHGGTQPINTLRTGNYSGDPGVTTGCAVNPKSGDLAVAGYDGLTVFFNGQENHATYLNFDFSKIAYVGYDNKSNLYIDGTTGSNDFLFAELPAGASAISEITLSGGAVSAPGGIQWDGRYIDVGDAGSGNIYQTDGTAILGTVSTGATCGGQFSITENRKRVVLPDFCSSATGVYTYPSAGAALKTADGQSQPLGAAISVASP
ncbi:MAG TPA: hypothetical protein VGF86_15180 [Candidatus Tumulicola sp.]|jgi:hypothetical protein